MNASDEQWPDQVFQTLTTMDVRQVAYVPDAGHTRLINRCRAANEMTTVPLTTEEEGIALLAGAWLGGQRGVLLMQSSGVGNCINMLSLARTCRFPLLMLVTMRGEEGEGNPWQNPMGQIVADVLTLAGVAAHRADAPEDVASVVSAAAQEAFGGSTNNASAEIPTAAAVLIAQRVVGVKAFAE